MNGELSFDIIVCFVQRAVGKERCGCLLEGADASALRISAYTKCTGISTFKKATTPFLSDSSLDKADDDVKGQLTVHSSKCTMKVLWLARLARPDVMKACNDLTTKANNWSRNDDKRLYRIFCYLHTTRNHMLCGHIGDHPDKLFLRCFTDADFCGDSGSTRSTSGGFLALAGPKTFFP